MSTCTHINYIDTGRVQRVYCRTRGTYLYRPVFRCVDCGAEFSTLKRDSKPGSFRDRIEFKEAR